MREAWWQFQYSHMFLIHLPLPVMRKHFKTFWSFCFRISRNYWRNVSSVTVLNLWTHTIELPVFLNEAQNIRRLTSSLLIISYYILYQHILRCDIGRDIYWRFSFLNHSWRNMPAIVYLDIWTCQIYHYACSTEETFFQDSRSLQNYWKFLNKWSFGAARC